MSYAGLLFNASNQLKKRAEKVRTKKCRVCKKPFIKRSIAHVACSSDCALSIVRAKKEKAERKEIKERKEKLKTRSDWLREAQVAWNRYVRLRDHGLQCASCGARPAQKRGGTMDCSHYRSVGSAPHLRFHLHNAAAACVRCNRDLSGNVVELRKGLIERIGLQKVEELEADNRVRKFDSDYLKRLKVLFTKKANRVEKRLWIK